MTLTRDEVNAVLDQIIASWADEAEAEDEAYSEAFDEGWAEHGTWHGDCKLTSEEHQARQEQQRLNRGRCPGCNRTWTLTKTRMLRRHIRRQGVSSVICPGSGGPPA